MLISHRKLIVEWGHCDPANIVFYPNYFTWFDASTANHFKEADLPKPELVRRYRVVGFPMVKTGAEFHLPSSYGDEIVIETQITDFGRASFEVEHKLFRDEKLAVTGHEKRVLVTRSDDGKGIKSFPIPEEIKALFASEG
ncbi:MAG: acyl-CoA thioesterase [Pseudomonadota bacterium]